MVKLYAYGEAKPPAREQLWHEITGFLIVHCPILASKEARQSAMF